MAYKNYIPIIEQKLDKKCQEELEKWGFIAQLDGNRNYKSQKEKLATSQKERNFKEREYSEANGERIYYQNFR